MNAFLPRFGLPLFLSAAFLTGCATAPVAETDPFSWSATQQGGIKPDTVERTGNAPRALLSYYQSLAFFTPNELLQEKRLIAQHVNSPDGRLRLAMVLGHPRQPNAELKRANGLLTELLKAEHDPTSYMLQPITRMLANSYSERLRLEQQSVKQSAQLEKLQLQTQELQGKLDGLADIERSLPQSRRR
jgi:hypothetical protein